MNIGVVTLFPEMFRAMNVGMCRIAQEKHAVSLSYWDPRSFSQTKHKTVDDRSYGGGPGMVMCVPPLRAALQAARKHLGSEASIIYLSPQGSRLHQKVIEKWVEAEHGLILVSGRYEGIDERLMIFEPGEEWSLGDLVLSGGEIAAMAVIDAIARLLPGVLGNEDSAREDSFANGLLDCPHYTRPATIEGLRVPSVLLTGDHKAIKRWRLKQALGRSWLKRPDLLQQKVLSQQEQDLLDEFIIEIEKGG